MSETMEVRHTQTLEELLHLTSVFRSEVIEKSKGIRWCWIAEWDCDYEEYLLGVKYEGQTTWVKYPVVVQRGAGPAVYEWMDQLNEREGLAHDDWWSIWNSGKSSANACLSDDETRVVLVIGGASHRPDLSPKSGQQRCIFSLEFDLAIDLYQALNEFRQLLPRPNKIIRDVKVVENDDGDVTLFVPGELNIDPNDEYCFTLVVAFQTAADLHKLLSTCPS